MTLQRKHPCDHQRPTFSIITVVFNDENNIEKTIKSVQSQTCKDYEYIVIDGGSNDNTLSILKKHNDLINILISEGDLGIYDAMNKGVTVASGEFISFMNSGDTFFNIQTLEIVRNELNNVDILYGLTEFVDSQGNKTLYKPESPLRFYFNLPFNHQSMFIRTQIHKENLYNIRFRVYADLVLFFKLSKKNIIFRESNVVIATYDSNGISSKVTLRTLLERFRAGNIVHGRIKNLLLFSFFSARRILNDAKSRLKKN
ncbi:glycosyltransferase family 2 protein [Marinobacter sp.]|uniref:glycosyltransferase family 2 protein n=1 Tax=Marinobacter sp. TaxID=50741 RepID=UPI0034A4CECC